MESRDVEAERKRGEAFWKRYDKIRESQDTTDEWVSRGSDFKPNHIAVWKSRCFIPRAEYVYHIASRLGETVEFLLEGKKPKYITESDQELLIKAKKYANVIDGLEHLEDVTRNALSRAIVEKAEPIKRRSAPASPEAPRTPISGIPAKEGGRIDVAN